LSSKIAWRRSVSSASSVADKTTLLTEDSVLLDRLFADLALDGFAEGTLDEGVGLSFFSSRDDVQIQDRRVVRAEQRPLCSRAQG